MRLWPLDCGTGARGAGVRTGYLANGDREFDGPSKGEDARSEEKGVGSCAIEAPDVAN